MRTCSASEASRRVVRVWTWAVREALVERSKSSAASLLFSSWRVSC